MSEKINNISEDLVHVNRVTKVNKGGRTFSFAVTVIVGDENGRVGYGTGKAKEVTEARIKATKEAKKNMVLIPLYKGRTIHHDVQGKSGAAKVLLRRAAPGTGVIAGGPLRSVFGRLGVEDLVAKSHGSSSPNTMIAATFNALQKLRAPKQIAARRNKNTTELSVV
ncbi:MAG TPA: 30S ribosomal protein S5 [Candidatus Megaira endosymbiont of Nemacystus decipiens]|nr:30S ribosomal protein S5 [Candidatus Megaera endosymbiont of Nemacystus decipiens]